MKPLSQQQIKQEELKLLQMSGFSLGQYAASNNSSPFFKDLPDTAKIQQLERLKTSHVKNFGLTSNANLKAFAFTLLTSIYSSLIKQDILNIMKSCLYSSEMDLTAVKHSLLPKLGNKQMKKLVVEFLFTLAYASYDDKIQDKLRKYPIVMDILVIFLRCLLAKVKVKNADDCLFKLSTKESYELLINLLDVNCKFTNSMYLFYDDRAFLYQNQNHQVLVGLYSENDGQRNANMMQLKKTLKLSELQEEFDEDTENDRSERPSMSSHNRSLQLRGVVSESIVFEPQAPTPFFNLESDNNSSFQSNQDIEGDQLEVKRQKDSMMKGSKEMSLLKLMDRSMNFQQNTGGLGNIARSKIIENQMKQSIEGKQALGMIMDSPITLDSPHTLFSDGNFGSIGAELQVKEEIRVMKKSKSESASRMSKTIENNNEEHDSHRDMKKKEYIHYGQPKRQKPACICSTNKKKAIKLCSNLYEINMMYVPSKPSQPKRRNFDRSVTNFSQNQAYTITKGVNFQSQAPAATHNSSLQYIRYNDARQRSNPILDSSIHSCNVLQRYFKDSQTQSRRQFSPISNTGQRSASPYGQTRSIVSPKVTFSYQLPLKHSAQFKGKRLL